MMILRDVLVCGYEITYKFFKSQFELPFQKIFSKEILTMLCLDV